MSPPRLPGSPWGAGAGVWALGMPPPSAHTPWLLLLSAPSFNPSLLAEVNHRFRRSFFTQSSCCWQVWPWQMHSQDSFRGAGEVGSGCPGRPVLGNQAAGTTAARGTHPSLAASPLWARWPHSCLAQCWMAVAGSDRKTDLTAKSRRIWWN